MSRPCCPPGTRLAQVRAELAGWVAGGGQGGPASGAQGACAPREDVKVDEM